MNAKTRVLFELKGAKNVVTLDTVYIKFTVIISVCVSICMFPRTGRASDIYDKFLVSARSSSSRERS